MVTGEADNSLGATDDHPIFDAIVIGTGFAGAVTACRLVEAKFSVCILERGRRYGAADFPRYPVEDLFVDSSSEERPGPIPDFSRWFWSQDQGLYDVCDLGDTVAVQAAGYGGGSLIYANVHLRPPYDVFDEQWPVEYRGQALEPYFDLTAYVLRATPVPRRLEKTVQMKRAGHQSGSWFRVPLAVHFGEPREDVHEPPEDDRPVINACGREQRACDMRARCWRGCDRQAKNSLDLNYLARAEDGECCDVHTLTEATRITRDDQSFIVFYRDVIAPARPESVPPVHARGGMRPHFRGRNVFLCAGAVNTTRLLFASDELWMSSRAASGARIMLGTRYFPNSDSLAIVRNCDEPHEADYGPTITSALLYDHNSRDLEWTLDFADGRAVEEPGAGMWIRCVTSGACARLVSRPLLDCGDWKDRSAAGSLMLTASNDADLDDRAFPSGETFLFFHTARAAEECGHTGSIVGSARIVAPLIRQRHWFLVQEGGYPPDLEPLVGLFSSPLWLRRNRYLETPVKDAGRHPAPDASLRRSAAGPLRLRTFMEALGATSSGAVNPRRTIARTLNTVDAPTSFGAPQGKGPPQPLGIIGERVGGILPAFFVDALAADRNELINRGVAAALPLLAHMLDGLAVTVVRQIDPSVRRMVSQNLDDAQLIILARGLIRQVLQVLAGSEVAVADNAARIVLDALPDSPMKLADLVARSVLWAIGYDTITGNTAVLLTMGRDTMRGRLEIEQERLTARLPSRFADRPSAAHEYVLRDIAANHWHGELRTNPGWTTLGRRVTVHSQGGCPMGEPGRSVTDPTGQVRGIEGLYVMDAAAFPASVGVNPSATIAAIAEYKVAEFMRSKGRLTERWSRELEEASEWVDQQGRGTIDPLNRGAIHSYPVPERTSIGLTFEEALDGWYVPVTEAAQGPLLSELASVPQDLSDFRNAEAGGLAQGKPRMALKLVAATDDLARLIEGGAAFEPAGMTLTGIVRFEETDCAVDKGSKLQLFVRHGERKFFKYEVHSSFKGKPFVLHGVKVLANDPGFDIWHDTSTVYFESTGPVQPLRGILRVSLETFLNVQMREMKVTGTTDPARKSWALLAFYKYFANELSEVYVARADAIRKALFELVTSIHV